MVQCSIDNPRSQHVVASAGGLDLGILGTALLASMQLKVSYSSGMAQVTTIDTRDSASRDSPSRVGLKQVGNLYFVPL